MQKIFDQVRNHLLAQMEKSFEKTGCKYRGPNGLKCAAGIFIPDDKYSRSMEGSLCTYFEVREATGLSMPESTFLLELQLIHDCHDPSQWEAKLREFAEKHGLKF